jgi:hypothetical protein
VGSGLLVESLKALGYRRCPTSTFPSGVAVRSSLEDVLDMLVRELGVDHEKGWREALAAGRERWRRMQIRAAVRDAPSEAVAALQQLGYEVHLPDGLFAPQDNLSRLHEL